jgi:hypothetical protein
MNAATSLARAGSPAFLERQSGVDAANLRLRQPWIAVLICR